MATKPLSDLTATWNAGGTTFTAVKMNVTDTASAAGSALMDLQVGGVSQFKVSKAGAVTAVGVAIPTISSSDTLSNKTLSSPVLTSIVEVRDGTNAQTANVYNTYTDASNYERARIGWSGNTLEIGTQKAGTGSGRTMYFLTDNSYRWGISSDGTFVAGSDNALDIGGPAGVLRPRSLFLAGYLSIGDGVTAPSAVAGQARIYVDTADGDLKIIFGDGTIKTIVTDT